MYYQVKVKITSEETTPKGGVKEKITRTEFLVEAVTVGDAEKKAYEHLEGSMLDFQIASVSETKYEAVVK